MTEADERLREFGYRPELRRSVPTVDLIIYGLIFMVPIAPWAIFGTVYNASEGMVPLFGFCLLHVSVVNHYVIRKRSRNYLLHLVVPLIGFGIIGCVLTQADTNAKVGGVIWLAVGALVFLYFLLTGRSRELTIGEGA